MAVGCRSLLTVLVGFLAASQLNTAFASRHLSAATPILNTSALSVADSSDSALTGFDATQYLHAGCAVFLDNSTIFTAQTNDSSVPTLYRGMTATVINYASTNISVPWSFQLTSSAPGYSGIKQAFNFDNSSVTNGVVSGTATADYLTVLPKAANNITIGLLLEANATTFPLPQSFRLNGNPCSVVILPNSVPPPANITSPSLKSVQSQAGVGLTTLNGQIIDRTSGEPISLHGFNYFGFDNAQTCVDGLYAGTSTLSRDLVTIVRTQQALGFNAVRLLTSFGTVFGLAPVPQSGSCTTATAAQYQAYLTDPATPVAAGSSIPELAYSPPITEGICSDYLDGFASTFDRYMFVISLFARNGFYVVLDNQLNDDPTLINSGESVWLGYWRQIATAVAADPYAVNKVIIDPLNEPDSYGIRWEPTATRPGYGALLLDLMDALYPIIPGSLYFVEGVDQECSGGAPSSNWGDGFASQAAVLALFPSCGISNPGPVFFDPLLTRPYLSQVIISPHVYGPSISLTTDDDAGTALWTRLSQSFGYLNLAGYGGHRFPIAIGEFGTTFAETADQVLFADLARYLLNVQADGTPVDALHNPITSFFWFAWNANSGDTGGLVTSPSWDSIVWQKIEYLQSLGLAPWYTGAAPSTVVVGGSTAAPSTPAVPVATVAPVPAATNSSNASVPVATTAAVNATPLANSVPTNTTPVAPVAPTNSTPAATSSTPVITAVPTNTSPAVTVTPTNTTPAATNSTLASVAPNSTTPTESNLTPVATDTTPATTNTTPVATPAPAPVPSPINSTPTATPATTAATVTPVTTSTPSPTIQISCSVAASYSNYWIDPNNGPYMTSISLFITNTAIEVIAIPWSIEIISTQYTAVEYTWNWQIGSGYDGSSVSGTASYAWQDLQPQGNAVSLGWVAGSAQSTNFLPSSVSINGHTCAWA